MRYGKLSEMNRADDIVYWQKQGPKAIFDTAWELVLDYYKIRKLDPRELEFQRTVGGLRKA